MDLNLGSGIRVVVAGSARERSRYGQRPDGTRGPVGVETDSSGNPLATVPVTVAGGLLGWVESAAAVVPAAMAADLPPAGSIVEFTGDLRATIRGGDFGSTRVTVTGVVGVRVVGSAVDAIAAVGSAPASAATRDRAAS